MTKLKKGTRDLKKLYLGVLSSFLALFILFGALQENAVPTSGETALFFQKGGDDLRSELFHALKGAKESIDIALYALTDEALLKLLKQKANEGVSVSLLFDAEATKERRFGKIDASEDHAKGLMHLKLFVIDKKISYIGSTNGSYASLRNYSNSLFRIDSKEVSAFLLEKMEALRGERRFSHRTFLVGDQSLEIWFLPDDQQGAKRLVDLMRSAEKTLQVAMYTFTRDDFAEELIDAKKRGVSVSVFLDRSSSESASRKIFEKLKKSGVFIKRSNGKALLHDKMLVIDGKCLVQGSANWTRAAFTKNEDCFMVLEELTAPEKKKVEVLFKALERECS